MLTECRDDFLRSALPELSNSDVLNDLGLWEAGKVGKHGFTVEELYRAIRSRLDAAQQEQNDDQAVGMQLTGLYHCSLA